jgi:hypothetical protein
MWVEFSIFYPYIQRNEERIITSDFESPVVESSSFLQPHDNLNSSICVDLQGNVNSTKLVPLPARSSSVQKIQKHHFSRALWTTRQHMADSISPIRTPGTTCE